MAKDLLTLMPELILLGAALLILLFDLYLDLAKWRSILIGVGLLSIIAALIVNVNTLLGSSSYAFNNMLIYDGLGRLFNLVLLISCGLSILLSADYVRSQRLERGEYYALMLFSTLGAMLMGKSADLITLFLGLETLSLPLYILVTFARSRPASQEAGLKYFLLGAFSTAFFLYGLALIYGAVGTTHIPALTTSKPQANLLLYAGLGLIIIGLAFKAAIVPFHTWAPDAYEGAPTSVTAFMAVAAKVGAFAALLRVLAPSLPDLKEGWGPLLGALAMLTMIVGNVIALVQTDLKRMLAYSGIAHAGYMLIGVIAGSPEALLFYLLAYTFMNLGAFGILILLEGERNSSLFDYSGLGARAPALAAAMALFMISLAGLPPTAGFMAKLYIFSAAIREGSLGLALALVGVLTSVISVYFYMRLVYFMYMRSPEAAGVIDASHHGSLLALAAILIAAFFVLHLGLFPSPLLSLIQQTLFLP